MKFIFVLLGLLTFPAFAKLDDRQGGPDKLIDLQSVDASIRVEMPYATPNNFAKKAVYPASRCCLRRAVAEALGRVQSALRLNGVALKVYDCYRPISVQKIFWAVMPDENFVDSPAKGSTHNRGAAVDVTLVDRAGIELDMPSQFDDFSPKSARSGRGRPPKIRRNLEMLESAMESEKFIPLPSEWWHFDYLDATKYPIEDVPFDRIR